MLDDPNLLAVSIAGTVGVLIYVLLQRLSAHRFEVNPRSLHQRLIK